MNAFSSIGIITLLTLVAIGCASELPRPELDATGGSNGAGGETTSQNPSSSATQSTGNSGTGAASSNGATSGAGGQSASSNGATVGSGDPSGSGGGSAGSGGAATTAMGSGGAPATVGAGGSGGAEAGSGGSTSSTTTSTTSTTSATTSTSSTTTSNGSGGTGGGSGECLTCSAYFNTVPEPYDPTLLCEPASKNYFDDLVGCFCLFACGDVCDDSICASPVGTIEPAPGSPCAVCRADRASIAVACSSEVDVCLGDI